MRYINLHFKPKPQYGCMQGVHARRRHRTLHSKSGHVDCKTHVHSWHCIPPLTPQKVWNIGPCSSRLTSVIWLLLLWWEPSTDLWTWQRPFDCFSVNCRWK